MIEMPKVKITMKKSGYFRLYKIEGSVEVEADSVDKILKILEKAELTLK